MSHLSKISISIFLHHFLKILKGFILMQTPLQLDIWLQSYEEFVNAKNNIKQRNWNTVFANISKPISPTSDSFPLIMSQVCSFCIRNHSVIYIQLCLQYYNVVLQFGEQTFCIMLSLCNFRNAII